MNKTNKSEFKMGDDVKYVGQDRAINKRLNFKIIRLEDLLVTIQHQLYKTQIWRVTYPEIKLSERKK